jgi:hypothetical protein
MRVCYLQIILVEDVSIAAVSIRVSANWMKFFHIASMLMKKGGQTEEVRCNGVDVSRVRVDLADWQIEAQQTQDNLLTRRIWNDVGHPKTIS